MEKEAADGYEDDRLSKLKRLLDQGFDIDTKDVNGRTLLIRATMTGQYEAVKYLLEKGADVLVVNNKNNSPLHMAVARCDDELVSVILESISRDTLRRLIDIKTKVRGNTALYVAAKTNCHVNVSILLEYGANYEARNNDGERAVDVTDRQELRELFELVDASFAKARTGDASLIDDLSKFNCYDIKSTFNCRNNSGYTIVQELVINEHYGFAGSMLDFRVDQLSFEAFQELSDPSRDEEVEKLVRTICKCRAYWLKKRSAVEALLEPAMGIIYTLPDQFRAMTKHARKLGSRVLEKVHRVLLASREFDGKEKSLTTNSALKTLEEVFEVIGINPDELHVGVGEESCYYENLPPKLRANPGWIVDIMNNLVEPSLYHLLRGIYTTQMFDAVRNGELNAVKRLLANGGCPNAFDGNMRTILCYAVEEGDERIIQLLLEWGARVVNKNSVSPVYLAVRKANARIVKLLLEKVDVKDMPELVDRRQDNQCTMLHVAAKKGCLDIVQILMRHGATYWVFDEDDCTPLDVSTSQQVSDFLTLVDECFHDAKEADLGLVSKLKAMQTDEFLAVAGTKNFQGQTLAIVAAKANARNIAAIILMMIRKAKRD